ncbi:MAG: RNA polymerase factor sigma-32 [Rhodobiaceae bacterium]|nr:RNA polymerase factor sigma-32 [Rhodobiaceae bacterium]
MTHIDTQETLAANRRYFKGAMKVPLLEQEHELELARLWRQDQNEKALHELTSAHLRLVIAMATKFRHYGLPVGDLVQEGNIGLMQAADRFDIERGVRFSTYASWWIRASIQDFILRNWSIVRTGTTAAQKSLFFNLRRLRARINDGGQNNMTHESRLFIAKELGVRLEDVETMEGRLSGNDRSLNAPMSEADGEANSLEWQDLLVCDGPLPDDVVSEDKDSEVRRNWIKEAMETLNEREYRIISERRLGEENVTLECLGVKLGISKERVRQIEHQALDKLKHALTKTTNGDPVGSGLLP